jgi:ferredoxin
MECTEYPIDIGCLFLGEAATKIDPSLGHLVTKEEALEHVRKAREAGLVHLIGRNKLDVVWLQVGPGTKLLTICNCCPCCCLWRMLPDLSPHISGKITKMPGVTVSVTDACVGCGICTEVCFVDAISVVENKAVIGDACRGCGRCVDACPHGAIELTVDDGAIEKTVEEIGSLVDLRHRAEQPKKDI